MWSYWLTIDNNNGKVFFDTFGTHLKTFDPTVKTNSSSFQRLVRKRTPSKLYPGTDYYLEKYK